jgi:hypothetical protein
MAFPITNQADLYYRNQTPNPGANSGNRVYPSEGKFAAQPYIIRDIGQRWGFGLGFDEGLVRGGIVTLADRTANDVIRLTKFSLDLPKGPLFYAKQIGLQLMNPRMWMDPSAGRTLSDSPTSDTVFSPGNNSDGNSLATAASGLGINLGGSSTLRPKLISTQLFNPLSPIAQAGLTPIGLHFQRHGIPFISNNYEDIVKENNKGINNLDVENIKWGSSGSLNVSVEKSGTTLNDYSRSRLVNLYVNHILYDYENNSALIEYPTGPGSMLGIGSTTIRRYENTRSGVKKYVNDYSDRSKRIEVGNFQKTVSPISDKIENVLELTPPIEEKEKTGIIETRIKSRNDQSVFEAGVGVAAFTYDQIKENPRIGPGKTKTVKDFRKTLKKGIPSIDILYDNYDAPEYGETASGSFNIHDRVGVADLGNHSTPTTYNGFTGAYDKIGATDIHSGPYNNGETGNPINENGVLTDGKFTRDLVKFSFESINNDNPAKTDVMVFRAYISSFKDDFDAKWNSVKYIGRGEDFYTYEGFSRKISVDFNIFAHSRQEMKPLYRKLLYLFSQTAPDLSAGGKMRAPLMRLTIGNWFYRLPGFITSIGTSVDGKETPWEIALNQPEGGTDVGMLELPKYLSINLSYTPIHNFTPKRGTPSQLTPFLFLKSQDGKTSWL